MNAWRTKLPFAFHGNGVAERVDEGEYLSHAANKPKSYIAEKFFSSKSARLAGVGDTRSIQYPSLPDIQDKILFLPRTAQDLDPIKEAVLRPIAETLDWNRQ
jgi:hypothetical protein